MRLSLPTLLLALTLILLGSAAPAASPGDFDAQIARAKQAMMVDPDTALAPATTAEALAATLPGDRRDDAIATAQWLRGEALSRTNHPDQALPILKRALSRIETGPDIKLKADLTFASGSAEAALGDVSTALASFQAADRMYVGIGDTRGQAKALLSIGGIYSDAGDLQHSLQYYSLVPEIYRGDPAINLAAHNNLGETLKKLGRYPEAEAEYRKALADAHQLGSPQLEVRILPNLASAQLLAGNLRAADETAAAALALPVAGASDASRPFVWGVRAQVALRRGALATASGDLDKTFAGVDLEHSSPAYRDFHDTAYQVYERLGRADLALRHLEAFKRLDDEVRSLTASSSAALMTARFDFASQNLRIARLKAEQVRKDALLATSKARTRAIVLSILLAAGLAFFVLLLLAFLSIVRSRNRERAANAELHKSNTALEKALKVKTEFLATTSHEIRTPLNGILGMTQVLLADRSLAVEIRERVAVVHDAGETMRALVDDILDVAKIENGSMVIAKSGFDLHRLLNGAGQLWRGQAEAKGLSFVLDLALCPDWIEEDEGRLRQIVLNLLSNAVKFTDAGRVELRAVTTGSADDERLQITVRDSGIGISEADQELIFESFRQVEGGTNRRFSGTGLGLAICRQLARAMGGDVRVDSRTGEGSVFTVELPLTRSAPAPCATAGASEAGPATTLREAAVLIVDANPLSQRILARVVDGAAARVATASSVPEAVALLESGIACDHLLIDATTLALPLDTIETEICRLAAAMPRSGGVSSVLVSGEEEDRVVEAWAACMGQVLRKPIAAPALIDAMREIYAPLTDDMIPAQSAA